ncbi:MAG: PIG-L family deacetylase [Ignavibacteria bacterium]|nr:PIG-L family deacetylase [Ignavibacteria bacterium]
MKTNYYSKLKYLVIWLLLCTTSILISQPVKSYDAAEIKLALKKLNVLGAVLYIGAHPDDENTAFLSYCSAEKLLRTGYLSLTRGDGGQNLIGTEQAELLGVIRTQELLQARKLDGADQFFTRAVDFGYTKSSEETFKKWNKNELLSDVVWVIRKFRPDVIVTRFPTTGEGMHGQHTTSAIVALEAFKLAGDPNAFPDQLKYVDIWTPKRIYWNGWTPAFKRMGVEPDTLIKINLGSYNTLLGKSYTEISAEGRSMHKSQGFGDSGWRGNYRNYFIYMDGNFATNDLFSDIDITWNRVKNGDEVSSLLNEAYENFDAESPSTTIPLLMKAYKKVNNLSDEYWSQIKGKEILNLIRACAGIWIEAVTDDRIHTPGSKFLVKAGVVNRSDLPFKLEGIHITHQVADSLMDKILLKGYFTEIEKEIHLPESIDITQPYWLENERNGAIYNVSDQSLIGIPEKRPPLLAHFRLSFNKTKLVFRTPVLYRKNDPTRGEVYSPIVIAPPVTANFESNLYLFPSDEKRELTVTLKNFNDNINGELILTVPGNWKIVPQSIVFEMTKKSEEKQFVFIITPPLEDSRAEISACITIDNKTYTKSFVTIKYDHIPEQTVFSSSKAKMVRLNIGKRVINRVGYIMGSGDKIPDYLRELGFKVDILKNEILSNNNLSNYDVIIAGIRAYNTVERMDAYQDKILKYVRNGGTYVVQYNTLGKRFADPGPYKLKISRDRVTEEDANVAVIDPQNQLLQFPNTITENDFNGWVQERGLYFPNEWDDKYVPILEMNDTDESPKRGSVLFAKYGEGIFIYTGLSFFREFPAGVPGAYRLFINLISAGKFGN